MQSLRYSITLNEAQLDYLSDEQQDILRMKCLKTFIRMAVLEETKVSGKNYSGRRQPVSSTSSTSLASSGPNQPTEPPSTR